MNQQSYSWDSRDYQKHSSAQYTWAQGLIGKLRLTGNESVLDIGCGDGKVTALLYSHVPKGSVTGIDSSGEMVSFARSCFSEKEYPRLTFLNMDARNLNFKDQFDIAFSNATLHWVDDHAAVLTGVRKGLKNSGKILFQMGGKGNAQDVIDCVHDVIGSDTWKSYFHAFSFPYYFYSPEDYEPWLREAGLECLRNELIPKEMTQMGEHGFTGWFRTTWLPYTNRIPENRKDAFVDTVVSLYIKRFPIKDDGLVRVRMVRLEVEAVRA